ncbi:MAG: CopG family ribbon-helix-helix protein [Promethearchaeota archaeon]
MSQNKKEEYERFSISLPKDLFEEFERYRKSNNITRSEAIRRGMRMYLKNIETLKEFENKGEKKNYNCCYYTIIRAFIYGR